MNNKRFRNHIYHFIDVFFLSFPFLFILYYTISPLFILNFELSSDITSNINQLMSSISVNFSTAIDIFIDWFTDSFSYHSGDFISLVDNIFENIFNFFGIFSENDPYIWYFIKWYFIYIICYEFLSLIINVILWIPRYFRDWSQRHSREGF